MVWIYPFKGLLYNQEMIENLAQVVAPPYDVISPEAQEGYYQKHPDNVIRLILSKEFSTDTESGNRYTRTARTFKTWLDNKVLIEDTEPALYFLKEIYQNQGNSIIRKGFICTMKLEEIGSGQVLPHEKTHAKPKIDRLNLMRSCGANFSQVFGLYSDPAYLTTRLMEQEARRNEPVIDIIDEDGIKRSLWAIKEPAVIETISQAMKDRSVIIADGHHRYETALNFAREMAEKNPAHTGQEPYNRLMIYLTNMEDEGTVILPTHRLVRNIPLFNQVLEEAKEFFEIERKPGLKEMLASMKQRGEKKHVFGVYSGNGEYDLLSLKDEKIMDTLVGEDKSTEWKKLDVSILQQVLIDHLLQVKDLEASLKYTKDEKEAIELVEAGQYQVAFLLNPTRVDQLQHITAAGELMPQKSTYFYPKLLSGLVINKIL